MDSILSKNGIFWHKFDFFRPSNYPKIFRFWIRILDVKMLFPTSGRKKFQNFQIFQIRNAYFLRVTFFFGSKFRKTLIALIHSKLPKKLVCSKFSLILLRNRDIWSQRAQNYQNCLKSCNLQIWLSGAVKKIN